MASERRNTVGLRANSNLPVHIDMHIDESISPALAETLNMYLSQRHHRYDPALIEQYDPDWQNHMIQSCWGLLGWRLVGRAERGNQPCVRSAWCAEAVPLYCQLYIARDGFTVLLDDRMECHRPKYYWDWLQKLNFVIGCAAAYSSLHGTIWRDDELERWSVSIDGNSFPVMEIDYPTDLREKMVRNNFIR